MGMSEKEKERFERLLTEKAGESDTLRENINDLNEKMNILIEENYTLRNQMSPKENWHNEDNSNTDLSSQLISDLKTEKKRLELELEKMRSQSLKREIILSRLQKENTTLKKMIKTSDEESSRRKDKESNPTDSERVDLEEKPSRCNSIRHKNNQKTFELDRKSSLRRLISNSSLSQLKNAVSSNNPRTIPKNNSTYIKESGKQNIDKSLIVQSYSLNKNTFGDENKKSIDVIFGNIRQIESTIMLVKRILQQSNR